MSNSRRYRRIARRATAAPVVRVGSAGTPPLRRQIDPLESQIDRAVYGFADEHIRKRAVLSGEVAADVILQAIANAEDQASLFVHELSPTGWLRALRTAPLGMFSRQATKFPSFVERRRTAELLSSRSDRAMADDQTESDSFASIVNGFMYCALEVANLRIRLRLVAQGVAVRCTERDLEPIMSSPEYRHVQHLDSTYLSPLASINIVSGTVGTVGALEADDQHALGRIYLEPTAGDGWQDRSTQYHYQGYWWRLPAILKKHDWYEPRLPVLLAFERLLVLYLQTVPEIDRDVRQMGFMHIQKSDLLGVLALFNTPEFAPGVDQFFPDFDKNLLHEEALLNVLTDKPAVRPLVGGPIVQEVDATTYMIDLEALSNAIHAYSGPRFGLSGEIGNERAVDFELSTQSLIDASDRAPCSEVRGLRGVKLKAGTPSRSVTDIDSMLMVDELLVLVDCKSKIPHGIIEREFQALRKVHTDLADELAHWREKVQWLGQHPLGNNYDLRAYPNLAAMIVIPAPMFLYMDMESEECAPGIPAVMSIDELEVFIATGQTRWNATYAATIAAYKESAAASVREALSI